MDEPTIDRADNAVGAASVDLLEIAQETAGDIRAFLVTIRSVAQGGDSDTALPMMLLALSQINTVGARLGAMVDIVPRERFEADAGPDVDLDGLREGLVSLLTGVDEYAEVTDPVLVPELVRGHISNDVVAIAADLAHGLKHYDADRFTEALWWWQFSYLSSWGERGLGALRALLALLSHVRLDADEEMVMEAQLAALYSDASTA
ncbi:MAG: DUF5063 domain-containing protein [Ornithinimicrobium sp.]